MTTSNVISLQKHIPSLDGLRGLAALAVMVSHYSEAEKVTLNFFTANGTLGVLVFFALSGFIMGHIYDEIFAGTTSARIYFWFLSLRIAKLYPLHIALTIIFATMFLRFHVWGADPINNNYSLALNVFMIHGWGGGAYLHLEPSIMVNQHGMVLLSAVPIYLPYQRLETTIHMPNVDHFLAFKSAI